MRLRRLQESGLRVDQIAINQQILERFKHKSPFSEIKDLVIRFQLVFRKHRCYLLVHVTIVCRKCFSLPP